MVFKEKINRSKQKIYPNKLIISQKKIKFKYIKRISIHNINFIIMCILFKPQN